MQSLDLTYTGVYISVHLKAQSNKSKSIPYFPKYYFWLNNTKKNVIESEKQ